MKRATALSGILAVFAVVTAVAGPIREDAGDTDWCRSKPDRKCVVREIMLPAGRDVLVVDARSNGGIQVTGWDRDEIRIRARVEVWGGKQHKLRDALKKVRIDAGDTIRATGPKLKGRRGWAVSYRIMVPHRSNLDLTATNGTIHVADVDGRISAETSNGGLRFERLAGEVRGRTINGGVDVVLSGERWDGAGLDARATNGSVNVRVPGDYSAEFDAGTVNGGIRADFPVRVEGKRGQRLRATLGDGGAAIRLETVNGNIRLRRDSPD